MVGVTGRPQDTSPDSVDSDAGADGGSAVDAELSPAVGILNQKGPWVVSPIMRDGFEWRDLQKKLEEIVANQGRMKSELEKLETTQGFQHGENHKAIEGIEREMQNMDILINGNGTEDAPGLKSQMTKLMAYGEASVFWGKVVAALLTLLFAGLVALTAYDASKHVSSVVPLSHVRQQEDASRKLPQDAGIPLRP